MNENSPPSSFLIHPCFSAPPRSTLTLGGTTPACVPSNHFVMNKTFSLILIFVSSCALCCSRFRSSTTATSVQSPSVDEQRPVAPASCPVTAPPTTPFTPPGEREMGENDKHFWLGTEKLWISLPKSGQVWVGCRAHRAAPFGPKRFSGEPSILITTRKRTMT